MDSVHQRKFRSSSGSFWTCGNPSNLNQVWNFAFWKNLVLNKTVQKSNFSIQPTNAAEWVCQKAKKIRILHIKWHLQQTENAVHYLAVWFAYAYRLFLAMLQHTKRIKSRTHMKRRQQRKTHNSIRNTTRWNRGKQQQQQNIEIQPINLNFSDGLNCECAFELLVLWLCYCVTVCEWVVFRVHLFVFVCITTSLVLAHLFYAFYAYGRIHFRDMESSFTQR